MNSFYWRNTSHNQLQMFQMNDVEILFVCKCSFIKKKCWLEKMHFSESFMQSWLLAFYKNKKSYSYVVLKITMLKLVAVVAFPLKKSINFIWDSNLKLHCSQIKAFEFFSRQNILFGCDLLFVKSNYRKSFRPLVFDNSLQRSTK